jgi:hypothetical protein
VYDSLSQKKNTRMNQIKTEDHLLWYHGSPLKLTILRAGSTITRDRRLAEVFSHKPALVCISDEGDIRHNGTEAGFLYRISEEVQPGDVYAHPRSTMPPGLEWLTMRELKVTLLGPVQTLERELISEEEIEELRRLHTA